LERPGSTDEPRATPGRRRGGGRDPLRFPPDAIGGVEEQLTTLRREVDLLLRLVDVAPADRGGGPFAHADSDVRLGGTFPGRHPARCAPWGNANR
jgi:hypothetical protein